MNRQQLIAVVALTSLGSVAGHAWDPPDPLETPLGRGEYSVNAHEVSDIPVSRAIEDFPEEGLHVTGGPCAADAPSCYHKPEWNRAIVYYPTNASGALPSGNFPLVVYGHGMRSDAFGTPEDTRHDYRQLGGMLSYLASFGYVVVAPDLSWLTPHRQYETRSEVFKDAIDYMVRQNCRSGSPFEHKIRTRRVGLVGHSMGSRAAMLLGGRDDRVQAIAVIGPRLGGLEDAERFRFKPFLMVYGSLDAWLWQRPGYGPEFVPVPDVFAAASPAKYRVSISGGSHFGFTDEIAVPGDSLRGLTRQQQLTIARGYLTAFFERHLSGSTAFDDVLHGGRDISEGGATLLNAERSTRAEAIRLFAACSRRHIRTACVGVPRLTLEERGDRVPNLYSLANMSDQEVTFEQTLEESIFLPEILLGSHRVGVRTTEGPLESFALAAVAPPGQDLVAIETMAPDVSGSVVIERCRYEVLVARPGLNVEVRPVDRASLTQPVHLTFSRVDEPGFTSVDIQSGGLPPPWGYEVPAGEAYFAIETGVVHSGSVEVCVDLSRTSPEDLSWLELFEQEDRDSDGTADGWIRRTQSVDTEERTICGEIGSVTTLAVFEGQWYLVFFDSLSSVSDLLWRLWDFLFDP